MKKTKRITFFIVAVLIIAFTVVSLFGVHSYYGDNKITYIKGASDIRWGIDIRGGVEAVFKPVGIDEDSISDDDMKKAENIIKLRLTSQNITDYEINTDTTYNQIVVRFPWQTNEKDFDPTAAVEELGQMAKLTFCEGSENNETVILDGSYIKNAQAAVNQETSEYYVALEFTSAGASIFADATNRLLNNTISIWLDDEMISDPTVERVITNGQASITGNFTYEEVTELADTISAGALPFSLSVDDSKLSIVSPTLGESSLNVMLIAGVAAYILIVIIMIALYRMPGLVASLSITCTIAALFACISGFFPGINSFTLTIPGIAGIILSIGMGVDANVITAERIKDEFKAGKTIDGAINSGYKQGWGAILDGNVTVVIVSIVLMGAFGPTDTLWSKIVTPLMFMFKSSITGAVYSFGYTLLIGAICNLLIGVALSRLMTKSLAQFRVLRKPWLFGGVKNGK